MRVELFGRCARLAAAAVIIAVLLGGVGGALAEHHGLAGVSASTVAQADQGQPANLFDNKGKRGSDQPSMVSPTPNVDRAAAAAAEDPMGSRIRLAPHVDAFEPSGTGAPVNATIVLAFSQPMNRGSVEHSFVVRPAVDGQQTWPDDFTFRFQPVQLAHAVTYEVELGGRSARGAPLRGQRVWRFTTVAGPPLVLQPGPSFIRVPILMYHYIRVNPDPRDRLGFALSVTPSDFTAQMDWLQRDGFHPITLDDLYAYLSGARGLPARPVILSFDDGYADFYTTALPILLRHDFKAVSYVVTGFVGQPRYMTAAQVVEADRAGVEIASHTVGHVNLSRQSPDGLRYQLTASKQTLEHLLGHPVLSFCYPSGRFIPGVLAAVQAAGYRDATTTQSGSVRTLAGRYKWGRLRVSGGESLAEFAAAVLSDS